MRQPNFDSYLDPPEPDHAFEEAEIKLCETLGNLGASLEFYHFLTTHADVFIKLWSTAYNAGYQQAKQNAAEEDLERRLSEQVRWPQLHEEDAVFVKKDEVG